jgi:hypothetical protein
MELAVIIEILCHPMKDIEKMVINGEYDGRRKKKAGEVLLRHFSVVYME